MFFVKFTIVHIRLDLMGTFLLSKNFLTFFKKNLLTNEYLFNYKIDMVEYSLNSRLEVNAMSVKGDVCDCDVIHEEVVAAVKLEMLPDKTMTAISDFLKAISDPTRVKMLWALNAHEMCVCDLAFLLNMTKSAISHQLRTLKQANLVKFRKDGKVVYYSLADDHVNTILEQSLTHISE
jgi:ArsR family transcriptional regulator